MIAYFLPVISRLKIFVILLGLLPLFSRDGQLSAQLIRNLSISGNPTFLCSSGNYVLSFDTFPGLGNPSFQVQLSAPGGSFSAPQVLSSGSGLSQTLVFPGSLVSGMYGIRVVRSLPTLVISDTLKNIRISKTEAGFSFSPALACSGSDVAFTNTSTGTGALLYQWLFNRTYQQGAPSFRTDTNPTVQFNPFYGGGTVQFGVRLQVTDSLGCVDTLFVSVPIRQRPLAQFADSNLFSYPPFSNCQTNPTPGNPNYRLTIENQCQVQATIANIELSWGQGAPVNLPGNFTRASHVYTSIGAYKLIAVVTNNNGCVSRDTIDVSNQSAPTLSLSGPPVKQGCAPFTYPLIMGNYQTNSAGTYYTFDFNDGSPLLRIDNPVSDTVWHTFTTNSCNKTNGSFIVTAKAHNQCDSIPATLGNFRIWTKPASNFGPPPDSPLCVGVPVTLSNTTTSGFYGIGCTNATLWNWTFSGASISSSTQSIPPSLTYANPGLFPVKLASSNPCGVDSITRNVCVQGPPTASFQLGFSPSSKCAPNLISLINTSNTVSMCGPVSYRWTVLDSNGIAMTTDTTVFSFEQNSQDSVQGLLRIKKTGRYGIRLQVSNRCGASQKDTVFSLPSAPIVGMPLAQTFCDSQTIAFNSGASAFTPIIDSAGSSLNAFNWQIIPAGFSFVQGNASSRNPVVFFEKDNVAKTYSIILTLNNFCGQSKADTQRITILPKPFASGSSPGSPVCSGSNVQLLLGNSIGSGVSYAWRAFSGTGLIGYSSRGFSTDSLITLTPVNSNSGIDTVYFRVVTRHDATNCIGDSITLKVAVLPAVQDNEISVTAEVCQGSLAPVISGNSPAGGSGLYLFRWQKWDGTNWISAGGNDSLKDYSAGLLTSSTLFRRLVYSGNCLSSPPSISNTDTVVILANPVVNAGADLNKCTNDGLFQLAGNPAGGSWAGTGIIGLNSFNPSIQGVGTYSFVYTYTDIKGCFSTDTVLVKVNPFPIVNAGVDQELCGNNLPINLNGGTPLGGNWSGPGVNANQFDPLQAGSSSVSLIYQYTDTNNCSNRDTIQMNLRPKPSAAFSLGGADSSCSPYTINFSNSSQTNTAESFSSLKFRWTFSHESTPDTTINPFRVFTNSGVVDSMYAIQLIATSSFGCSDTVFKSIKIKPDARAEFSPGMQISCAPFVISNSALVAIGYPQANASYLWQLNGVNYSSGLSFSGYTFPNANDSFKISLIAFSPSNCKSDTQSFWYQTIPNPIPLFTSPDSVACAGQQVRFLNSSFPSSGVDFKWTFGNVWDTSNLISPIKTFVNTGSTDTSVMVQLKITLIGTGCSDSIQKNVVIKPLPKPDFAISDSVLCYGESALLFAGGLPLPIMKPGGNKWMLVGNAGLIQNDTASYQTSLSLNDFKSNQSLVHEVRLIATTTFGCVDSIGKTLRQPGRPLVSFGFLSDSACSGSQLAVQNNSQFALGYTWSSDDPFVGFDNSLAIVPQIQLPVHSGLLDSIYKIRLIAQNAEGCFDTLVKEIRSLPIPTIDFVSLSDSLCRPARFVFREQSVFRKPGTFFWNFGDGNQALVISDTVGNTYAGLLNQDTSYSVRLIVQSISGCRDTLQKSNLVRVKDKPKASFTMNMDSACSPAELYLTNVSQGSVEQYFWDLDKGRTSNLVEPNGQPISYFTSDSISRYLLKLRVTNMCGSDSVQRTLTVTPNLLKADFNVSSRLGCQSLTVNFGDKSRGADYVSWDFGDGGTSNQRNPVHTFSNPGLFKVVQYISNQCYFDTAVTFIRVDPKPLFSIQLPSSIQCEGTPLQFTSNLIDTGSIKWFFGDGDSSSLFNPLHKYTRAGRMPILVRLSAFFSGCSNEILDTLEVDSLPHLRIFTDTNSICLGQLANFRAEAKGSPVIRWNLGDGSTYTGNQINGYAFTKPGVYTIQSWAETPFGCKDSALLQFRVWPQPMASFSMSPEDTCYGPVWVDFAFTGSNADAYFWDFGNGETSTAATYRKFYQGIGKYPVQLRVVNAFGCRDTFSKTFEIMEQPFASFEFSDSSGCLPYEINFKNTSIGGKEFIWYFGDGDTSTQRQPSHTYTQSGVYYVSLVVKSGVVCRDSFTFFKPIKIDEKKSITFSHELQTTKQPFREVQFKVLANNDFRYEWRFGNGATGLGKELLFRYAEADSGCFPVELKVISPNNCDTFATDTVCLPPYWEGLYVPNAFAPSYGTEAVREFKPAGMELKSYHIWIYNKWGELVWESQELENGTPAKGWNGVDLNGKEAIQGTYIWMIEAEFTSGKQWLGQGDKGKNLSKRGTLTLIR